MIYHFTYTLNGKHCVHTCTTEREADVFFNILMSVNCEYICIRTFRRYGNHDKN